MSARQRAKDYRLRAQHCLNIAMDMDDLSKRMVLLDMAQAWMLLADQAARTRTTDIVYETPPATAGTRPPADASDGAEA